MSKETSFCTSIPLSSLAAALVLLPILLSGCTLHGGGGGTHTITGTRQSYPNRGTKPYTVKGRTYYPLATAKGYDKTGVASWYGPKFHGKKTASGEIFNQEAMTAAHTVLPFGTRLQVQNLDNGKKAVVTVNDRGPFVPSRIIDLSKGAARTLGILGPGTARVRLTALDSGYSTQPASAIAAQGTSTSGIAKYHSATVQAKDSPSGTNTPGLRSSTPLPPSGGLTLYYLQTGSFKSTTEASAHASELSRRGFDCRISEKNGSKAVQAGPWFSKKEAEAAASRLNIRGKGAFIVTE